MKKATQNNTLIIKSGGGYFHQGVKSEGYHVITPYIEKGLFYRLLRELCFRVPFLPKKVWYNKEVLNSKFDFFLIGDPLITTDYLKWIKKVKPNAQLNFIYGNMVGKAKHPMPNEIPSCYRVWSYDGGDCEKYGLRKFFCNGYFKCFIKAHKKTKQDVLFVGGDKGRGEYLLSIEKEMNALGISTKFIIVKSSKLDKDKPYYHEPVSYDVVTDMVAESKAVLNVAMPGQTGVTMRDLEAILIGVKLITTNPHTKEEDFYNPNNVYLLNDNNIKGLIDFLEKPMTPIPDEIKHRYDFNKYIEEITVDDE